MDLLGWLIFLVALLVSVMLHESGHFVAAKGFGMKCTRYFIGFGPTLWSTWRGETEYGIKALPFGGFVKIVGMTSIDEVDPEDEPRSFRRAPGWQRLIVLAAGSFMHFVLAAVLIFAARAHHRGPRGPKQQHHADRHGDALRPRERAGALERHQFHDRGVARG